MTALCIVLAVLLLGGLLPVGARVRYDDGELSIQLAAGPVRIGLYPAKPLRGRKLAKQFAKQREKELDKQRKKAEKARKKAAEKARKKAERKARKKSAAAGAAPQPAPAPAPEKPAPKKKKLTLGELLPFAQLALRVVGSLPRKLLVRELYLHAVFGGKDAAGAAIGYGRAWALIGAALPPLERCFRIRKRDVGVELDCDRTAPGLFARLDIRMRVGTAVLLAVSAAARAAVIFLQNKRKFKKKAA